MRNHKITKTAIGIMFILLLSLTVSAGGTADWVTHQKDELHFGFYGTDFFSTWVYPLNNDSLNIGYNYQALLSDFDSDDDNELFIQDGNYVYFLDYDNGWITDLELYLGNLSVTQPFVTDDGEVMIAGTHLISLINKTGIVQQNTTLDQTTATATACYGDYCYFGTTTCDFVKYSLTNNNYTNVSMGSSGCFTHQTVGNDELLSPIIINNLYGSNHQYFIMPTDYSNDQNDDVMMIDTYTMSLESNFCGDGVCDDINTGAVNNDIKNIQAIVSGGTKFLISVEEYGSDQDAVLIVLNTDGSIEENIIVRNGGAPNPIVDLLAHSVYGDFVGDGNFEYCLFYSDTTNSVYGVKCYDTSTAVEIFDNYSSTNIYGVIGGGNVNNDLIAAQINGQNSKYSMISHSAVMTLVGTDEMTIEDTNIYNQDARLSLGDINDDGNLDLIMTDTALTYIVSINFTNTNAEYNDSVSLGRNFANPICAGSTLIIYAYEDTPFTYTNDLLLDDERLVTDCGLGGNLVNGSFSGSTPTVSCTYNNATSTLATVYIQDDKNIADYTEYKQIPITVINGTAGFNCNLPASLDTLQGSVDLTDEDSALVTDLTGVTNAMTNNDPVIEGMIVLFLTIVVILALASRRVTSAIIYLGTILCLWIIMASINLFSWVYVILYAVLIIFLGSVSLILGRGESGG